MRPYLPRPTGRRPPSRAALALLVLLPVAACKRGDPAPAADATGAASSTAADAGGRASLDAGGADVRAAGALSGPAPGDAGVASADASAAGAATDGGASGSATGAEAGPRSPAEVARLTERSVFMLAVKLPGGGLRGICSSFAVAPKVLATNAHCIDALEKRLEGGGTALAIQNGMPGKHYGVMRAVRHPGWRAAAGTARVRRPKARRPGVTRRARPRRPRAAPAATAAVKRPARKSPDVALIFLTSPVPETDVARLAPRALLQKLGPGSAIHLYGFPGRFMRPDQPVASFTSGTLSRLTTLGEAVGNPATRKLLQHTAATLKGSSGSPLLDDSGRVVGVNAGSYLVKASESVKTRRTRTRRKVAVEGRRSEFRYALRADLLLDLMARQGVAPRGVTALATAVTPPRLPPSPALAPPAPPAP